MWCKTISLIGLLLSVAIVNQAIAQTQTKRQNHALLVGVSDFPNLPKNRWLNGPKNDVLLIRDILRKRGFVEENIHLLADNIDGATKPTRSAILGELDRLGEVGGDGVSKDDFVYLHFSTHGTQQPNQNPNDDPELDGLDEVLVPYDIELWDEENGVMQNAIIDDELREHLQAIRERGAFVWAVFDNCHSGTITRAFTDIEKDRRLEVPDWVLAKARVNTRGASKDTNNPLDETATSTESTGQFVSFFAAQPSQITPELMPNEEGNEQAYGLFSYVLSQVMETNPAMSYRQAAQRILQTYAAMNRTYPIPMFEGSGLDAPLFGITEGNRIREWPLIKTKDKLMIEAGRLQQLSDGSILGILNNTDNSIQGYVEITNAQHVVSWLKPIEYNDQSQLNTDDIAENSIVRLVVPKLNLKLTVAEPPDRKQPFTKREQQFLAALQKLKSAENVRTRINWVPATHKADIRLFIHQGELKFLLPSADLEKQLSTDTSQAMPETSDVNALTAMIEKNLFRIAKVVNLNRLAGYLSTTDLSDKLTITANIARAETGEVDEFDLATLPDLFDDDRIIFEVKNSSKQLIDLHAFFIDSKYGIEHWYPDYGVTPRIEPGETVKIKLDVDTLDEDQQPLTTGIEQMLFIAVGAKQGTPAADFRFLVQAKIETLKGTSSLNTLNALVEEAGFGESEQTRSAGKSQTSIDQSAMHTLRWNAAAVQTSD